MRRVLVASLSAALWWPSGTWARPSEDRHGSASGATHERSAGHSEHHGHHADGWAAGFVGGVSLGCLAGDFGWRDRWYRSCPYDWYGNGYAYSQPAVIYVRDRQKNTPPAAPPKDLQPGVDLIKISILNSNGVRTDVPILRVGGQFVGPQGEEYEALPSAEVLARRYGS
jgi:hypothetical protein